jgi:hypothetical protein
MNINVEFSRACLHQLAPSVEAAGHRSMKDAWVWHDGHRHWEFHGPNKFYWYGRADNAYDARFKGWSAFLEKHNPTNGE